MSRKSICTKTTYIYHRSSFTSTRNYWTYCCCKWYRISLIFITFTSTPLN
nr:MAG TPA: hypothetical protein [Caudoviricetes sp.]